MKLKPPPITKVRLKSRMINCRIRADYFTWLERRSDIEQWPLDAMAASMLEAAIEEHMEHFESLEVCEKKGWEHATDSPERTDQNS